MSLFRRTVGGQEARAWTSVPDIPPNSQVGPLWSSHPVDLRGAESSLQKVAIYAAVRLLREVATTLPLDIYTPDGNGSARPITMPSWLKDPSGEGYGLEDWLGQVVYSDAMRGNVVAKIASRDTRTGQPRQLVLQHPDSTQVWRDPETGRPRWYINGSETDPTDVWHRRSFPVPGAVWGLSPIGAHALTISQGLAAAQFGAQWFQDGAHPSAILQNKANETINQDQAATVKARFLAAVKGTREPVVLGSGWEYQPIQIAPGESQFLEVQRYTASECARIFGPGMPEMLGYETGNAMTYSNVEQRSLHLLTYTIDPWLVRLERILTELLPETWYAKFNRGALLRTDLLTRFKAHEIAIRNDFETVNEVRELEDRQPVEWGYGPRPDGLKTMPPVPVQMEQ